MNVAKCSRCDQWTQGWHLCSPVGSITPLGVPETPQKQTARPKAQRPRPHVEANRTKRNDEIVRMYENGATCAAIGVLHNLSAQRVGVLLKEAGVQIRGNDSARRTKHTPDAPEFVASIVGYYLAGKSQKQIASLAHTSTVTVRRVLKENGVEIRVNAITAKKLARKRNREPVVTLRATGKSHAAIAQRLGISVTTVERILRAERNAA